MFDHDHVCKSNKIATLPSYYTDLPPLTLPSNDIIVPETAAQFEPSDHRNLVPGEEWLEHTRQTLTKTELGKDDTVLWAAYHMLHNHRYHIIRAVERQGGPRDNISIRARLEFLALLCISKTK